MSQEEMNFAALVLIFVGIPIAGIVAWFARWILKSSGHSDYQNW